MSAEPGEGGELFIRPAEAARRLGIGRTTLFALLRTGEIDSVTLGAARLVPVEALRLFAYRLAARPVDRVLGRLVNVRRLATNAWEANCPLHGYDPPLSIGTGSDGRVLLHCPRGCDTAAIVRFVDLDERDLLPKPPFGSPQRRLDAQREAQRSARSPR